MQRISVVGNSGSGKSLLARRIAAILGAHCVELDAIHHLPGWEAIDPDMFLAEVEAATASDAWVIDGNYRRVVPEGPVWQRADTQYAHLRFVRLRSHDDAERWLGSLRADPERPLD